MSTLVQKCAQRDITKLPTHQIPHTMYSLVWEVLWAVTGQ